MNRYKANHRGFHYPGRQKYARLHIGKYQRSSDRVIQWFPWTTQLAPKKVLNSKNLSEILALVWRVHRHISFATLTCLSLWKVDLIGSRKSCRRCRMKCRHTRRRADKLSGTASKTALNSTLATKNTVKCLSSVCSYQASALGRIFLNLWTQAH